MKADPTAQARLLDLQDVDTTIAQLRHRIKTLPEHELIAGAKSKWAQVSEDHVRAETVLSDAEKAQARAEADLKPVRERLQRDQERVDGGEVRDPKALRAMVDEIEHLKGRIATLEDAELEVMQDLETATEQRDRVAEERASLRASIKDLMARRDEQTRDIEEELSVKEGARATIAKKIPADLLAAYTKTATRLGGRGAALLDGRRCTGCGLEANPADARRYDAATADEVLRCEECGRILVRR